MSTALPTRPELVESDADDGDNLDHYFCCDPDISCCGLDISGVEDAGDDDLEDLCEECDMRFGTDCGDSRCPYRETRQSTR